MTAYESAVRRQASEDLQTVAVSMLLAFAVFRVGYVVGRRR